MAGVAPPAAGFVPLGVVNLTKNKRAASVYAERVHQDIFR